MLTFTDINEVTKTLELQKEIEWTKMIVGSL